MEKFERRSEEETYLWIPFQFLNEAIKAILKCLDLLHHDSPTTTKTSSASVTLNQPKEEEEDVTMEDDVAVHVTTRGSTSGVVITSRGTKVKAKAKKKERVSSGQPGKHH